MQLQVLEICLDCWINFKCLLKLRSFENIQKNQENFANRRSVTIKSLSDTFGSLVLVNISARILEEWSNNKVSESNTFSTLKCMNEFFFFAWNLWALSWEYTNKLSQHFQKKCANSFILFIFNSYSYFPLFNLLINNISQ